MVKILCLSNGHGEDAIAVQIAQALQRQAPSAPVMALPMVGEGHAYHQAGVPILGPVKAMPSGGFIYMDGRQFARDVQGGLLTLTWAQFQAARRWAQSGGVILAVGDIVPLLLAWGSGAAYAFVGTAKSEYYLRDELGVLPRQSWGERFEGWSGSVYLPWERWLMQRSRCRGVFPRDRLTHDILVRFGVQSFDLGNPMMDGLTPPSTPAPGLPPHPDPATLSIVLLPGSRPPEAYANWAIILTAVGHLCQHYPTRPLQFLAAIAPSLDRDQLTAPLLKTGWQPDPTQPLRYHQGQAQLVISQADYAAFLHQADLAIAMTGTATEQVVGLGKPALTLAGPGPQCTPAFVEAQTRLLGPSVCLLSGPEAAPTVCDRLLSDPDGLHLIAANGQRRLGSPGAADRIATCLRQICFAPEIATSGADDSA